MERMNEIYNITNKMGVLNSHINYFNDLEYREKFTTYGNGDAFPFSGLEKELQEELKYIVLTTMKKFYNKYQKELSELCKSEI